MDTQRIAAHAEQSQVAMNQFPSPNGRVFENHIFTSQHTPHIQVSIDPAFSYIGNVQFELKGIASVDRHIFVEAENERIRRMIIFQFEGFLENNARTYNFKLENPVKLG